MTVPFDKLCTSDARLERPTYEHCKQLYHLKSYSAAQLIGILFVACGFLLGAFGMTFGAFPSEGLLFGDEIAFLANQVKTPGIIVFLLGLLLMIADTLKRRFMRPYTWEIEADFVRAVLQENLIPHGFDKSQFRFKVKRLKNRLYEVRFSLDFPNCTYEQLTGPIKHIAASFGCPYTYSFEEDTSVGSKYSRRYRYRLKMELSDLGSAYKKAGV